MDQALFKDFQWRNESKAEFTADALVLHAPANSDYFYNTYVRAASETGPGITRNAPFFYTEVTGDFVLKAQVEHAFQYTYDAAAIMIMQDTLVWAKACFEQTEYNTHAIVSVVTNHISDDANGCNIRDNAVWLQAARAGNTFAFHYSEDGKQYYMARYFSLPMQPTLQVGLVPQSPVGKGGDRVFRHVSLESRTLKNIRAGI